jgi:mannosylglycerate hydrolase
VFRVDVILVATTHWDREWYRTFQAFRARLVDTVDRVLDLIDGDHGYTFLLDGQAIVLEDYLEIRPGRRSELERRVREGRIEIGPWYVQPDSLLPGGEAHIRNLIEGRRVASALGPVSRVAYTPDSFGHPAQFPQLFAGFGLEHFVYWRGNDNEIAELPAEYAWTAPDGTAILACHLWLGYGNAAGLPHDIDEAVKRLTNAVEQLSARTTSGRVLLLAGTDHQPPDAHTGPVCDALAQATGWNVRRGLLRDFVDGLTIEGRPSFEGELLGGRIANLLPSVWSTRTYLKIANRRCETELAGWAEPWAALGSVLGLPDERPGIRVAWRELLQNQAHDSICGCSQDAVHDQMLGRYAYAFEIARETKRRSCERIAGLDVTRRIDWSDEITLAVFNPSPHTRTNVVRFPVQGYPPFDGSRKHQIHPLNWVNMRLDKGFEVDGRPARKIAVETHDRVRIINEQSDFDVEFIATDVPAFGFKTFALKPSDGHPETVDDGRIITNGGVTVEANDDGTLDVDFGGMRYERLLHFENTGDRGDSYDFDPVAGDWKAGDTTIERAVHPNGVQVLRMKRYFAVPTLAEDRTHRSDVSRYLQIDIEVRVAEGVDRVDVHLHVHNEATDHRVRMLFPTDVATETFEAATTLDTATRSTAARDGSQWLHVAPATFPMQGWVHCNGLTVVAPGLYEGEVAEDGTIKVTLLRSVGWLSRMDLRTRPSHAGPALPTPGAQCLRDFDADISLFHASGADGSTARDAELGLFAVAAGAAPLAAAGASLLTIEPREVELSALKPSEDGEGFVLRVLNPTDGTKECVVRFGFDVGRATAVRLDEEPADESVTLDGRDLRFDVPAHALRSVRCTS